MAFATLMNCSGDTDVRILRLRNACNDPVSRFEISTPFGSCLTIFQPLEAFPKRPASEEDKSSWMQLSLANFTYLLSDSSLTDLTRKHFLFHLSYNVERYLLFGTWLVRTRSGWRGLDRSWCIERRLRNPKVWRLMLWLCILSHGFG